MVCNNSNEWLRVMADMWSEEAIPPGRSVTPAIAVDHRAAKDIGLSGIYRMDEAELALELERVNA